MTARHTTRRAVLTAAAIIPTAALPGMGRPSSNVADRELFEIEAKVRELLPRMRVAGDLHTESEEAMIEWKRLNPEPEMKGTNEQEKELKYRDVFKQLSQGKTGNLIKWPEESADAKAAKSDHSASFAEWSIRHNAALKECRSAEREAAWEEFIDQIHILCDDAAEIPATTLEGLKCKARLADTDGSDDDNLGQSIVRDLLAWQEAA
jgi:hypothetical protein